MHTTLVSAKTGYGIEDLITNIYIRWMNTKGDLRSDIYLVGCTNAGKSTLFNSFLQSDLCKVRALDLVERVTTSVWPGTTLSLLKFPLMNPSTHRLELRRRRLISLQAWAKKEQSAKEMLYSQTKDLQFLTLSGVVDNTFKENLDRSNPTSNRVKNSLISNEIDVLDHDGTDEEQKIRHGVHLSDIEFTHGHWCFDTPGTVSREQVLDLYTLDELITLVPRKLIIPRFTILRPGESLLFGGTARLDFLSTVSQENPVYLAVYCSDRLPLHVMKSEEVEEFLEKFNGTNVVGVPFGDKERLDVFPALEGKELHLEKTRMLKAISDIVLSSIGWATVYSVAEKVSFKALTPEGRGITTRPPLLPFAIEYKGSRIPGTSFYKVKPMMMEKDEPEKRRKFHKRR
uniref:G domain-containing protein n=1 Tax=Panagrolaimus superbus TaxID=310955 RepID=A0A914YD32_9BILA